MTAVKTKYINGEEESIIFNNNEEAYILLSTVLGTLVSKKYLKKKKLKGYIDPWGGAVLQITLWYDVEKVGINKEYFVFMGTGTADFVRVLTKKEKEK